MSFVSSILSIFRGLLSEVDTCRRVSILCSMLSVARCLLSVVCFLSSGVSCLKLAICCLVSIVCGMLSVARCLMSALCFLSSGLSCLKFAICCPTTALCPGSQLFFMSVIPVLLKVRCHSSALCKESQLCFMSGVPALLYVGSPSSALCTAFPGGRKLNLRRFCRSFPEKVGIETIPVN